MLAVALIMLALMAAVMPSFFSAIADSKRKECRMNMRAIANAEREYMIKDSGIRGHQRTYAADMTTLKTKVSVNLNCPGSGTYSIAVNGNPTDANYGFTVSCSDATHNAGYGSE